MARHDHATPAGEFRPIEHPGAWTGSDFEDLADITFELDERHLQALDRGLGAARASGRPTEELRREDFPLVGIEDDVLVGEIAGENLTRPFVPGHLDVV